MVTTVAVVTKVAVVTMVAIVTAVNKNSLESLLDREGDGFCDFLRDMNKSLI